MIDYSRNKLFVDDDIQIRMRDVVIGVAGCGMGSVAAEGLLRTGFRNFLLADGDMPEISNLNRQIFTDQDVLQGVNKAIATAQRLRTIDPEVRVTAESEFLVSDNDMRRFIRNSDFVLNTVDFDVTARFNAIARELGRTVLFPFNIGFGSALIIFTPESPTLEEMLNISTRDPPMVKLALVEAFLAQHPRPALLPLLAAFQTEGHTWPYDPQTHIALSVGSALIEAALVQLVARQPVKTAPMIIASDASMAVSAL